MGRTTTARDVSLVLLLLCCVATQVAGSAIPMWEFLTRDEKTSYLYRVFSTQVAQFCIDSPRPDCNKNLLVTGIRNLASMDDNLLDKLDPYQHGAKEMIWRSMVGTYRYSSRVGYKTDESYYTTGSDPLVGGDSDTNGLAEETATVNDYVRPSAEHSGPYLLGPMVIRVFPDGRPVPEDSSRPLPKDEDAEEMKYARLPSIGEIEASGGSNFYSKSRDSAKRPFFAVVNKKHRRRTVIAPVSDSTRHRGETLPYDGRRLGQLTTDVDRAVRYY